MQPSFKTFREQDISLAPLLKATNAELTAIFKERRQRIKKNLIFFGAVAASVDIPTGILTLYTQGGAWPLFGIAFLGTFGTTIAGVSEEELKTAIPKYAFSAAQQAVSKWAKELSADGIDDIGAGTRDRLVEHLAGQVAQPHLGKLNAKRNWLFSYKPALT